MSKQAHDALQTALAALEAGAEFDAALELYPDLAPELKPALEAALLARAHASPYPSPSILTRSRARLLGSLAERGSAARPRSWYFRPRMALAALALLVALLAGGTGLVAASAQALPGDGLYPLKRGVETVTLRLAVSASARGSMEARYRIRRLVETRALLQLGRQESVTFEGVLRQMGEEDWLVDDIPVRLAADATVAAALSPGVTVEITGQIIPEGTVLAQIVRLRTYIHVGTVELIGDDRWQVGQAWLRISPLTLIDSRLHLGDPALALVRIADDESLDALAILRAESPSLAGEEVESALTPAFPAFPFDRAGSEVEFHGYVENVQGQRWLIGGIAVIVDQETEIKGSPSSGAFVKVHAQVQLDGSLLAREIERVELKRAEPDSNGEGPEPEEGEREEGTSEGPGPGDEESEEDGEGPEEDDEPEQGEKEKLEFEGTVTSIGSSSWIVDGLQIFINPETDIEGKPRIGDRVKVVAYREASGPWIAKKIEKED